MRITVELLRKRAEHNEGCLADLEEIALHQQEIEKLEVIGDACRKLQILYLCNNYIPKIEGFQHMKCLKYLNLAVNNITRIEGLEGCESLEKLDLTLNFIGDIKDVRTLRHNVHLEILYLTGNPCLSTEGARSFIVENLPQLVTLDGEAVKKSERIRSRQDKDDVIELADEQAMRVREEKRIIDDMKANGVDPFPAKYDDKGERVYGHTPEERIQILREQQEREKKKKEQPKDPNSISAIYEEANKKPAKLTPEEEIAKYGRVLQKNEAKVPFQIWEEEDVVVVNIEPGKYISTASINIDVEPTWLRVTIKGKILQLVLPVEVAVDKVKVQRAQTNGHLKLTMPIAEYVLAERKAKKDRYRSALDVDSDSEHDDENAGSTETGNEVKQKGQDKSSSSGSSGGGTLNKKMDEHIREVRREVKRSEPSRVEELDDDEDKAVKKQPQEQKQQQQQQQQQEAVDAAGANQTPSSTSKANATTKTEEPEPAATATPTTTTTTWSADDVD